MIDKSKIPYEEIADTDEGIELLIRTLNKFEYWATTQCCQGHPFEWKRYPEHNRGQNVEDFAKWSANFYIRFEVYNEEKFLELSKRIQTEVMRIIKEYLFVGKGYDWTGGLLGVESMRWSISFGDKTEEEVYRALLKVRKLIWSEVIQAYSEMVEKNE